MLFVSHPPRYMISAKINVEPLWNYSKENNLSFFTLSFGVLLKSVNLVSQLKRRIIKDKIIEYDYLKGVTPIMNENDETYKEMCVEPPQNFDNILEWYNYVEKTKNEILKRSKRKF